MAGGRILRIDHHYAFCRSPRGRWSAHASVAVFVALIGAQNIGSPEGLILQQCLQLVATCVVVAVLLEFWLRYVTSFEVQLLPGAIRVSKWWCDELLIEPEVVGGRIAWNQIRLRARDRSASIGLGWFNSRQDRAAIIEHCSQFLTAEQQAAYGHEWARRYHQLLSARKPPAPATLRGMLCTIWITYFIGLAICLASLEPLIACGITETNGGVSFRMIYAIWTATCVFFSFLLGAAISAGNKRARECELAKQRGPTATISTG
jgi:hypothetical protein